MATKVLVKDGKLATYGGKVVEVEVSGAEAIEWHQCPEAIEWHQCPEAVRNTSPT